VDFDLNFSLLGGINQKVLGFKGLGFRDFIVLMRKQFCNLYNLAKVSHPKNNFKLILSCEVSVLFFHKIKINLNHDI
jgi:hypothetical protein